MLIHYAINLDVNSSFMDFSKSDYMFIYIERLNLFFFSKKKIPKAMFGSKTKWRKQQGKENRVEKERKRKTKENKIIGKVIIIF